MRQHRFSQAANSRRSNVTLDEDLPDQNINLNHNESLLNGKQNIKEDKFAVPGQFDTNVLKDENA